MCPAGRKTAVTPGATSMGALKGADLKRRSARWASSSVNSGSGGACLEYPLRLA